MTRRGDHDPAEEDYEAELAEAVEQIRAGRRFRWSALTGYQRWSLILAPIVAVGCLVILVGAPSPDLKIPFALLLVASLLQFVFGLRQARREQGLN